MADVLRFHAPGPWITRDLKECVLASDYDALAARLAEAERERDILRSALNTVLNIPDMTEAQLAELKAMCRKATTDSASGGVE
jgi:hypothetical protein